MSDDFGTLEWTRRTGGTISPQESRKLLTAIVGMQFGLWGDQFLHALGLRKPVAFTTDLDSIAPPDSEAAKIARVACEAVAPEYLVNHSERSYLWGRIIGEQLGLQPDPELLYVAAMFHDTGLTDARQNTPGRPDCFTLLSIEDAERELGDANYDPSRIEIVSVAIAMHLNVGVDAAYGPEAQLLNRATAMDVAGMRLWQMPQNARGDVIDAFPRLGQNEQLSACWCREAKLAPKSRAGWYEKYIQFSKRIGKSPLGN